MAETLDTFPRPNRGAYPWAEWFDGRIWQITAGEDFPEAVFGLMRSQVYKAATKHGIKARVSKQGDSLIVQAILPDTAAA